MRRETLVWMRRVVRGVTLTAFASLLYAWAVEPRWLEVTHHQVPFGSAPLRVVHLTDLHTRGLGPLERRVIDAVVAADPDLVVITGDIVREPPEPYRQAAPSAEMAAVRSVLSALRAPLGVYAVPGNWEYWRGVPLARLAEGTGVRFLVNEAVEIRRGLWLVGLDDAGTGAPDEVAAFRRVPPGAAAIAILHSPAPFPRVAPRASLVFAGHSHGGQVRLPFLPPLWLPPQTNGYVAGWYTEGVSRLYVSRGVGTSILPVRFLCRPEVAVVDARP